MRLGSTMIQRFEQPELRPDLIQDLRKIASKGAGVRDLVRLIQAFGLS